MGRVEGLTQAGVDARGEFGAFGVGERTNLGEEVQHGDPAGPQLPEDFTLTVGVAAVSEGFGVLLSELPIVAAAGQVIVSQPLDEGGAEEGPAVP